MAGNSFLSDLLQRIAKAGPFLSGKDAPTHEYLITLCEELLGDRGEASGLKSAHKLLDVYEALPQDEKKAFFIEATSRFGVDHDVLQQAIDKYQPGDNAAARELYLAAEPKSQELIRRINRMPGATARLVKMRAELLTCLRQTKELKWLDLDFQHLFSAWFNRGFLEIQQIDWSTPAEILEKIIAYEAVHEINGWDDLRQRVAEADRRLFAFFHPAMPNDPLIFVEVALTRAIPGAIGTILERERDAIDPVEATTAVFYSISNCQKGLRGISFGNFLIKQVVEELQREFPALNVFVTLSPVPGLRKWLQSDEANQADWINAQEKDSLLALAPDETPEPEYVARLAANYLLKARSHRGTVFDPVAHFHLGNGALLHKIHAQADMSEQGLRNSWGVMVNYLYDGTKIEELHQSYATTREVVSSQEVRAIALGRSRAPTIAKL